MASKKTFESALGELEQIVADIESNEISLEKSLKLYKKAVDLIEYCSGSLKKAKLEVEVYNEKLLQSEEDNG